MTTLTRPLTLVLIGLMALEPALLATPRLVRAQEMPPTETEALKESVSSSDTMPPQIEDEPAEAEDTSALPKPVLSDWPVEAEPEPGEDPELPTPTVSNSPTPYVPEENTGTSTLPGPIVSNDPTPIYPEDWVSPMVYSTTTASSTPDAPSATTTIEMATSTGPTIQSGEAVALANILNIVNTNLVNSSGNAYLLNYTDTVTDTIDLRGNTGSSSRSAICALFACAGTNGVTVNLGSEADIKNAVVLNATSGGNSITRAGDAIITTGNAYAGLNLINVANTNIVDSNYLLLTMNAFSGVEGDIVFPSLTNFLSSLASNLVPGQVTATGTGTVNNTISTDAQTGGNSTSNTASSTIGTGSAVSSGNVFNQINTNMLGGATVSILFRVQGKWAGQVFGAPEGLNWTEGPDGTIALFEAGGTGGTQSMTQVTSSSTANIDNDISVIALTGENRIEDAASAIITTGNAYASANVLNVANTNVVGKNWIMAIVNIFGDFTGNIAFGRPDLWVGEQVIVPGDLGNGSEVTYKFTVINNGDSPATNVTLVDDYDAAHIDMLSSSATYTNDANGNLSWNLGILPPGGAVEVTYQGRVKESSPGTDITNVVRVSARETDNNLQDNTDTTTFTIPNPTGRIRKPEPRIEEEIRDEAAVAAARLVVVRETATSTTDGTAAVAQRILLTNTSGTASIPVQIKDVLSSSDGTPLHEEVWDVGSVASGETVALTYETSFGPSAPSGTYVLSTVVLDSAGRELGVFRNNGSIIFAAPEPVAGGWSLLAPSITERVIENEESIVSTVFPGIAVANAAENGAAATGFIDLPWPYVLALLLILLIFSTAAAWYRRRNA